MKKIFGFVMLAVSLLAGREAKAQYDKVWAFQIHGGLDFNNGTPQYISTAVNGRGNVAAICNNQGALLFYTDGNYVWDRNNDLMPGGTNLTNATGPFNNTDPGNGGTADATAISMKPGSSTQYYVFSERRQPIDPLSASSYCYPAKLYYSIVDMSGNNGLGAVITSGNYVDSNVQKLTLIPGDNCNIWLLTHEGIGGAYKAYDISASGIAAPVISPTTNVIPAANSENNTTVIGTLTCSPDRHKIALSGMHATTPGFIGAEIGDFDPATGIVSNTLSPPFPAASLPIGYPYNPGGMWEHAAFSPDNTKLYISGGYIAQYDLSTFPYTGMLVGQIMNGTIVDGMVQTGSTNLKLGPDGKIYFHYNKTMGNGTPYPTYFPNTGSLGVISAPNVAGSGCNVSTTPVLNINPGPFLYGGYFPNEIGTVLITDTAHSRQSICFKDSARLLAIDTTGYGYTWQEESGTHANMVYSGGLYVARYYTYNPCTYHIDTFQVKKADFDFSLGRDTVVCNAAAFRLRTMVPGASYRWQDGSTANTFDAKISGQYYVTVSRNGCSLSDSQQVTFVNLQQDLGKDVVLCAGEAVSLELTADNVPAGATVLWNTGLTTATLQAKDTGTYKVTVSLLGCNGSDSLSIRYDPVCHCSFGMPTAFSPNGDGLNDLFLPALRPDCPVANYLLLIYDRWGQLVFTGTKPVDGWNGLRNGQPADAGTYMYRIRFLGGTRKSEYLQKGDFVLVR